MRNHWMARGIIVVLCCFFTIAQAADKKPFTASAGFVENRGQITDQNHSANPSVKYMLSLPGFTVQLRKTGFSYEFRQKVNAGSIAKPQHGKNKPPEQVLYHTHRIDLDFLQCSENITFSAQNPGTATFNYYTPGAPAEGITGVRNFGKVIARNVYDGVDVEFLYNEKEQNFKYNIIAQSPEALQKVKLCITGAEKMLKEPGKITVKTRFGNFDESIPFSSAENNNETIPVRAFFHPVNDSVFEIKTHENCNGKIIIDPVPVLAWATYFGGSDDDLGYGMMIDQFDSVYISGFTISANNIATTGAHQQLYSGSLDGMIAKFDTTGQLVWATYYGGTGADWAYDISQLDASHFVVSGYSSSVTNISTPGSYQPVYQGGSSDAFLAKFTLNGTRVWATYYGGTGSDQASSVVCTPAGDIFIGGDTDSPTAISTPGTFQPSPGGTLDGFVAKFSPAGNFLLGTYFGGTAQDQVYHLALNSQSQVIFTGATFGSNGLGINALYQNFFSGGFRDGIFGTFDSNLNLLWSNYFGGTADDVVIAATAVPGDTIFICGYTGSLSGIASPGAQQTVFGGGMHDSYVAKFNADGSRIWSTYIGGDDYDELWKIEYHPNGYLYLCGFSYSQTGFTTPNALQTNLYAWPDSHDCAVVKISQQGITSWATYYGGEADDELYDLAFSSTGDIYTTGQVLSEFNISTTGVHQETLGNPSWTSDAVVIKFTENSCPPLALQINSNSPLCENDSLFLGITPGYAYAWSGPGGYSNFSESDTVLSVSPSQAGVYACTVTNTDGCVYTISHNVSVSPVFHDTVTAAVCQGDSYAFGSNTYTTAGSYDHFFSSVDFCDSTITLVLTVDPVPVLSATVTSQLCPGDTVFLWASSPVAASFQWTGPGGFSSSADSTFIFPAQTTNSGNYSVVSYSGMCSDTLVFTANVWQEFSFSSSATLCQGDSLFFANAWISSNGTYYDSLQTINGCDSIHELNVSFIFSFFTPLPAVTICQGDTLVFGSNNITTTGNYSDTLVSSGGCDSVITISVAVSAPALTLIVSPPQCFGDPIVISSLQNFNAYNWSGPNGTASSQPTLVVPVSGTLSQGMYVLTATDSAGCTVTDSAYISVPAQLLITASWQQPQCGNANGEIVISPSGGTGGYQYNWTPVVSTGATANNLAAGIYSINVTDQNFCSAMLQVTLTDSGGINGTINCGAYNGYVPYPVSLSCSFLQSNLSYQWVIDGTDTVSGNNQTYVFTEPGGHTVVLVVSDLQGCSDTLTCSYFLFDGSELIIPNVFSPDGNGANDTFEINTTGYKAGNIKIYNRWGQLLWESSIPVSWPGTNMESDPVPGGTYFYVLTLLDFMDQTGIRNGFVTLFR